MSVRIPRLVFLGAFKLQTFPGLPLLHYAGYPAPRTKILVRIWLLNTVETPWGFSRLCLCLLEYWCCDVRKVFKIPGILNIQFFLGKPVADPEFFGQNKEKRGKEFAMRRGLRPDYQSNTTSCLPTPYKMNRP